MVEKLRNECDSMNFMIKLSLYATHFIDDCIELCLIT